MDIMDMALNSERFVDWFIMSSIGLIAWWLGYITTNYQNTIKVPKLFAKVIFARKNKEGEVDLVGFSFQIIGILTLLLSFVAWLAPTHQQAIWIFGSGLLVIFLIVGIPMIYYRDYK